MWPGFCSEDVPPSPNATRRPGVPVQWRGRVGGRERHRQGCNRRSRAWALGCMPARTGSLTTTVSVWVQTFVFDRHREGPGKTPAPIGVARVLLGGGGAVAECHAKDGRAGAVAGRGRGLEADRGTRHGPCRAPSPNTSTRRARRRGWSPSWSKSSHLTVTVNVQVYVRRKRRCGKGLTAEVPPSPNAQA